MTKIIASDSEPNRAAYSESFLQPVPIQPGAGLALQCLCVLAQVPHGDWCKSSAQHPVRRAWGARGYRPALRLQAWDCTRQLVSWFLLTFLLAWVSQPLGLEVIPACVKCCLRVGCPCACCDRALCCLNSAPLSWWRWGSVLGMVLVAQAGEHFLLCLGSARYWFGSCYGCPGCAGGDWCVPSERGVGGALAAVSAWANWTQSGFLLWIHGDFRVQAVQRDPLQPFGRGWWDSAPGASMLHHGVE